MSDFKINNTLLLAQPETHNWKPRDKIGVDGNGRAIYPALYDYELHWGLMSMSEFSQLQGFVDSVGATGSVSADLPQYGASAWAFRSYSGCHLDEVTFSGYFEEYYQDVLLVVTGIRIK